MEARLSHTVFHTTLAARSIELKVHNSQCIIIILPLTPSILEGELRENEINNCYGEEDNNNNSQ